MNHDSFHDLLVRDLVYQVSHVVAGGPMLCVPEVSLPGVRFDAVAINVPSRYAAALEVKVSRADAQAWLRAERWKDAIAAGALPVLCYPESIDPDWTLPVPPGVDRLRKLKSGPWGSFRFYSEHKASTDLLFATLGAVRRETFYGDHLESLGEPIVEALARIERERAA